MSTMFLKQLDNITRVLYLPGAGLRLFTLLSSFCPIFLKISASASWSELENRVDFFLADPSSAPGAAAADVPFLAFATPLANSLRM